MIINNTSLSIAVLLEALAKANTCESDVSTSVFASDPANPVVPCFDLASDMVLASWVLELTAVIVNEPLS